MHTKKKQSAGGGKVAIKKEVQDLSLSIADRKEAVRLTQLEIERTAVKAKLLRENLRGMRVAVLSEEDANERSKMNALIEKKEKEIDDAMFKLATYHSRNRRSKADYDALEKRITAVRKTLKM